MKLTRAQKEALIRFTLVNTPISVFNEAIKTFSTGRIIYYMKGKLMREFPELLPNDLRFGIVMAEAFREFQVDEINLPTERYHLDRLKARFTVLRRMRAAHAREVGEEYNAQVDAFNAKLAPQVKMVRLYKRLQKHHIADVGKMA